MTTRERAIYLVISRIKSTTQLGHPTFDRLFKVRLHRSSQGGRRATQILVPINCSQWNLWCGAVCSAHFGARRVHCTLYNSTYAIVERSSWKVKQPSNRSPGQWTHQNHLEIVFQHQIELWIQLHYPLCKQGPKKAARLCRKMFTLCVKQARKSLEDTQVAGYARFEKV